jgi:hypothetical protein
MGQLIATLFLSRDVAHREHLKTKSFSQHMALGSFYVDIVENADAIAEAYQGAYDIIPDIPLLSGPKKGMAIDDCLEEYKDNIEGMRYKACDKEDTAIQNLIDEAIATYLSTLYKLRNLK